ncbi:DEAD (Asp-Glu-Ala-Asp) box polypeptide 59 [Entomortierella lignicola]|nr:DEAD (Asp-Glu-Ala-Asp) box polypeptide 59 [Entomortierella lignicola]
MLVPRTVSIRQKDSARTHKLPSLAETNVFLAQQSSQAPALDNNNQHSTQDHFKLSSRLQGCEGIVNFTQSEGNSNSASTTTLEQRPPLGEEPTCIVCGIYGDHLCDITDRKNKSSESNDISTSLAEGVLLDTPSTMFSPDPSATTVKPTTVKPTTVKPTTSLHVPFYSNSRIITSITGYRDSPRIAAMSTQTAKELRAAHQIHIQGKQVPKPVQSFEDCGLPVKMLSNLTENSYIKPTGIQMQALPSGLCGRDMILSAATGSGKTAAFLIPVLTHTYGLSQLPGEAMEGPFALILTPTRELAIQIEGVIKVMVKGMSNMRTALLVGGQAMANQAYRLKQNIQIAVATPGRMVDILAKHQEIAFSNVFCLVLDEVDLMLSMGFRKQVRRILDVLPVPPYGRQSIVCSATISRQVEQLVAKSMHDEIRIRIGDDNVKVKADEKQPITKISDVFSPSSQIKQTILWVENDSKKKQLLSLLKDPTYFRPPVLIFVESRLGADLLSHMIKVKCPGIAATSMHGEKDQEERSSILKSFMDGTISVVVATGLLARGLDLKVATVINFDMAPSIEEYVHRVGRANPEAATKAAAGIRRGPKLGGMAWAITFINNDHRSILSEFANMLHGLSLDRVTPLPPQLKQLIVPDISRPTHLTQLSSHRNKESGPPKLPGIQASKRKAKGQPQQQGRKKRRNSTKTTR